MIRTANVHTLLEDAANVGLVKEMLVIQMQPQGSILSFDLQALNAKRQTLLHVCALKGYVDLIQPAVYAHFNLEARDVDQMTPFLLACQTGNEIIITELLRHNIDVNATDSSSTNALHYAAMGGSTFTAQLLLDEYDMDVNVKNKESISPLHLAARYGKVHMIRYLCQNGAEIDSQTNKGNTPLHVAVIFGQRESAEALIAEGADLNILNISGQKARDLVGTDKQHIASVLDAALKIPHSPPNIDLKSVLTASNFKDFIFKPCPEGVMIHGFIEVTKKYRKNHYTMFLKKRNGGIKSILFAEPYFDYPAYGVYLKLGVDDREDLHVGDISANKEKTQFLGYTTMEVESMGLPNYPTEQIYTKFTNLYPRELVVVLPKNEIISATKEDANHVQTNHSNLSRLWSEGNDQQIHFVRSKRPEFDRERGAYVLDFYGLVESSSRKNIVLVNGQLSKSAALNVNTNQTTIQPKPAVSLWSKLFGFNPQNQVDRPEVLIDDSVIHPCLVCGRNEDPNILEMHYAAPFNAFQAFVVAISEHNAKG